MTQEQKHTAGTWLLKPARTMTHIHSTTGEMIGSLPIGRTMQEPGTKVAERQANAHLVAAAPELLEALRFANNVIHDFVTHEAQASTGVKAKIRAALAKAEGKA